MKLSGCILQQTPWAVLFHYRQRRIWLPKTLIRLSPGPREKVIIRLPRWLARVKSLAA